MKMIGESREDYLKAILIISDGGTISVRPSEIAKQLNVTYPSVTRAVKLLGGDGLTEYDACGKIVLTDSGKTIAQKILDKHHRITGWLLKAGVARDKAEKEACRIEHCISDDTFQKLHNLMEDEKL